MIQRLIQKKKCGSSRKILNSMVGKFQWFYTGAAFLILFRKGWEIIRKSQQKIGNIKKFTEESYRAGGEGKC